MSLTLAKGAFGRLIQQSVFSTKMGDRILSLGAHGFSSGRS